MLNKVEVTSASGFIVPLVNLPLSPRVARATRLLSAFTLLVILLPKTSQPRRCPLHEADKSRRLYWPQTRRLCEIAAWIARLFTFPGDLDGHAMSSCLTETRYGPYTGLSFVLLTAQLYHRARLH